jgi:hypothetical protein
MIGIWSQHSAAFLVIGGIATLLFALPMLVHPLAWARVLRWPLPAETNLAVYFGRCLGGVVTVVGIFAFVAERVVEARAFYFELVLAMVGVNILVHVWGAVRRIQPRSETIEIAAWVLLFAAGLLFFPVHVTLT